jgi:DNA-binding NarL/FixJ family response regulator
MIPNSSQTISLAVVNDHPLVVAGVAALLVPHEGRIQVVELYVGEIPPPGHVDVVLFDPFGRPDGAVRLREIVAKSGAKVLVFGWAQTQDQIDDMTEAGAAGFLLKTVDGAEILAVVEAAIAGTLIETVPAPDETTMPAWPGRTHGLSARESEILCLIVAGMTNEEIAKALYLSINSIKTYIRTAYRKIGVATRSHAVPWGVDHGFRVNVSEVRVARD